MSFYSELSDHILPEPRTEKCIVLDLDETLVHASDDMDVYNRINILSDPLLMDIRDQSYVITVDDVSHKRGTGSKTQLWAMKRPYLREFLIFCFNYFRIVAVWSAGTNRYVQKTVEAIFGDIAMPHIIYTRDDCEDVSGQLYKPLRKMIQNEPGIIGFMSLENTFALDDRESTYSRNPGGGILIPPYEPHPSINSPKGLRVKDNALLQLMNWLKTDEVFNCDDVSSLDKSNIFSRSLNSNPSNIPNIITKSIISSKLKPEIKVIKTNRGPALPKSLFLPRRCVNEEGTIICDPELEREEILIESNKSVRPFSPINSPFISFSPIKTHSPYPGPDQRISAPSPSRIYDLGSPPMIIKTPKTPQKFRAPDSPTYRQDKITGPQTIRIPVYGRRTKITE